MPLHDFVPVSRDQLRFIQQRLRSIRSVDRSATIAITEAIQAIELLEPSEDQDPGCTSTQTVFLQGRLSAALNVLRAMGGLPPHLFDFAVDPFAGRVDSAPADEPRSREELWVVPANEHWGLSVVQYERPFVLEPSRDAAIEAGRSVAKSIHCELVILDRAGRVETREMFREGVQMTERSN